MSLQEKYDKIEEFRLSNDLMYSIFVNKKVAEAYLRDGLHQIEILYEGKLDKDTLDEFKLAIDNIENDPNAAYTFWFFILYVCPSISSWFIYGSEASSPPPLANRERFVYYLTNIIPENCEALLSGIRGLDPDTFARTMRPEYLATCGVPLPPQFKIQNNTHYSDSINTYSGY